MSPLHCTASGLRIALLNAPQGPGLTKPKWEKLIVFPKILIDQPWHRGQATPGYHGAAGVDEQREKQALPVRLAAQGAPQGLFQGPLLQSGQREERRGSARGHQLCLLLCGSH